ncbi:FecCD family ABC transporter permease [Paenibacillus humicus]|uniref:FecCD family ABC transporter permease n=1 Tax=Paenibacillus humicus TaxID=412861 RepID=UPI000FDBD448|nr:iron ABC transporter permease [Paenibacillus humicus]
MSSPIRRRLPFGYKLAASLLVLAAAFLASMLLGAADIGFREVWLAMTSSETSKNILLIREFRLPRELAALAVGAALAVSGAVMQGMTRNPLADPGLLGLTAGANAMLAITIALFPQAGYFGIMLSCFAGASFGALVVFGIGAVQKGGFSPLRIVLAGAAVSALLYAVAEAVGLYFKISQQVSLWNSGGVIGTTWKQLGAITPFIAAGIVLALLFSRHLTIMSLNEDVATGLGQNIARIKMLLYVVVIILAGASVALVGNLAFLGLLVPHIARKIVGPDYRFVIPISAAGGGALMLVADTLGRTINAPYETSITAIVAMIGLPFFLWIVKKGGRAFQ